MSLPLLHRVLPGIHARRESIAELAHLLLLCCLRVGFGLLFRLFLGFLLSAPASDGARSCAHSCPFSGVIANRADRRTRRSSARRAFHCTSLGRVGGGLCFRFGQSSRIDAGLFLGPPVTLGFVFLLLSSSLVFSGIDVNTQ